VTAAAAAPDAGGRPVAFDAPAVARGQRGRMAGALGAPGAARALVVGSACTEQNRDKKKKTVETERAPSSA